MDARDDRLEGGRDLKIVSAPDLSFLWKGPLRAYQSKHVPIKMLAVHAPSNPISLVDIIPKIFTNQIENFRAVSQGRLF